MSSSQMWFGNRQRLRSGRGAAELVHFPSELTGANAQLLPLVIRGTALSCFVTSAAMATRGQF